jgi:hypothetical protein
LFVEIGSSQIPIGVSSWERETHPANYGTNVCHPNLLLEVKVAAIIA